MQPFNKYHQRNYRVRIALKISQHRALLTE